MADKKNKAPPPVFLCGTPSEACSGSITQTSAGLKGQRAVDKHLAAFLYYAAVEYVKKHPAYRWHRNYYTAQRQLRSMFSDLHSV